MILLQGMLIPRAAYGVCAPRGYPAQAPFHSQKNCKGPREVSDSLEGAGAGPSQRTGTRLGGVVSSRDCRLFCAHLPSQSGENCSLGLSKRSSPGSALIGELLSLRTASSG